MTQTVFLEVQPVLAVPDLERALAYYRDCLGFTIAWRWGSPPSRAGVTRDGLALQLLSDPDLRPSAPAQLYFHVRGVEAFHRDCLRAQAILSSPLETRPWGMRDFRVLDPGGNQLGFGEAVVS